MRFDVTIKEKVTVWGLPDKTRGQVKEALTIRVPPTPDSAEINKTLVEFDGFTTNVPRGFLPALKEGLIATGNQPVILDHRRNHQAVYPKFKQALRPHQEDAVQAIIRMEDGVIVAPPSAGKTVLALEAIRRSNQRAIIIVDRLNILDQWKSRCEEFLGLTPLTINGIDIISFNDIIKAPIVIGMQQSLNNKFLPGFYDSFGFAVLDECHHVSADTYLDVLQRFNTTYRIGLSATPYRGDGLDLISKLVIGPVIYSVDDHDLIKNRYIIKPRIETLNTGFEHDFWSTHSVTAQMICDKPKCPKNGKAHSHRNNYMTVTKALTEDLYRNHLIATKVVANLNNCNMIVSDRLAHLATLRERVIELGFPEERTYMLTGKENPTQRAEVIRLAGYGACAIFSTIAKEALDIPRLDRLYLTWPIKREHILEQQIGRITRTHPDKREAVCYDFVDEQCSVLANQAMGRARYYNQKNYQIN